MKNQRWFIWAAVMVFISILLAYGNHFNNSFHFDDSHTIVSNPYITNPGNWRLFFTDARTFSILPANQMYRPLFTLSVAIDYFLAGGLNPFFFHLTNFCWFLFQLVLMFFLFRALFDLAFKHDWNKWLALFGVAWYGLHTANAETINYISARSDLLSTFFVVAAFVLYIYSPRARKYFLYLIPFILGALVKPTALMFAPLLLVYILLFAEKPILNSILPFGLAAILFFLQKQLTPPTFYPANIPAWNYLITQPFVMLYYFKNFFLPFGLSADYDWSALNGIFNFYFLVGMLFIIILLIAAFYYSKEKKWRPIAFGIFWFFIALLPTSSLSPLSEVLNDHRVFFPFIGLMISVVWILGLILFNNEKRIKNVPLVRNAIVGLLVLILFDNALGVIHRNRVWKDEESLWYDVTIKSPKNGRGLMNYGLTQMSKGRYAIALKYFTDALQYTPRYPTLYINLGVANSAIGKQKEAEEDFKKALQFGPAYYAAYYYYGNWLNDRGRQIEAIGNLNRADELSPGFLLSKYLLLRIYASQKKTDKINELVSAILKIDPNDATALGYLPSLKGTESLALSHPSAENYLNLSLAYYRAKQFDKSIAAAKKAINLRPDYAEAYNNIGAAYNEMQKWDDAITALNKALALKPDFSLARNNLNWAKSKKR